jgi:hypothetical protein
MAGSRKTPNPKRRIRAAPASEEERAELRLLAGRAGYGGNPQHKRNPGDFQLTPPFDPRQHKTLCDDAAVFKRDEAMRLLRAGIRQGLISVRDVNGWPKNVWAVSHSGVPVEAILENEVAGIYHGYAMGVGDPLAWDVRKRWSNE